MSLISYIGTERNILDEAPENCSDRTAMTEVAGRLRAFLN